MLAEDVDRWQPLPALGRSGQLPPHPLLPGSRGSSKIESRPKQPIGLGARAASREPGDRSPAAQGCHHCRPFWGLPLAIP